MQFRVLRHLKLHVVCALKVLKKSCYGAQYIGFLYLGLNSIVFGFCDQNHDENIIESISGLYPPALPVAEVQSLLPFSEYAEVLNLLSWRETPSTASSRCIHHGI